ncbi:hypothetical protein [uncultured Thiohalocapsa sp.]|uniref:hypothetical protein n=1 Tax=uncultured Thiohalocapsa sp. TaxID=768990 RepID=UPI0025F2354A|nr:hypothetical protein [uncultured Thiohalocapsa sp.]
MSDHRYDSLFLDAAAARSGGWLAPAAQYPNQDTAYPAPCAGYGGTSPFGNVVEMGKLGAVVGLCGAGAANLHRLQAGDTDTRGAVLDTLRGGAVAGVTTAAATLVASRFSSGTLAFAATLVTGTAVAYALTAESPPDSAVIAADAAGEAGST